MRTTRFALLSVAFFLAALPAAAQITAQVNECVLPAKVEASVELLPCSVRFNALGEITFSIKNRGAIGVNTPTGTLGSARRRGTQTAGPQIKMDAREATGGRGDDPGRLVSGR